MRKFKLKFKFISVFGLINILVIILGLGGIFTLKNTVDIYNKVIDINTNIVKKCINYTGNVSELRSYFNSMLYKDMILEENEKRFLELYENVRKSIDEYMIYVDMMHQNGSDRTQEIELIDNINLEIEQYLEIFKSLKNKPIDENIKKEVIELGNDIVIKTYNSSKISFEKFDEDINLIKSKFDTSEINLIILFIFIIMFSMISGSILSIYIRKPIEKLKHLADEVSKGNLDLVVDIKNKDEIGELANSINVMAKNFKEMIFDINKLTKELDNGNIYYRIDDKKYVGAFKDTIKGINFATNDLVKDCLYITNKIKEIGEGQFNTEIKEFVGEKVVIKNDITLVTTALNKIHKDIEDFIEATNNGDLSFRIDTKDYKGEWKRISEGLNCFIDNIDEPIKDIENSLEEFSKGNFDITITKEYNGTFDNMKNRMNFTSEKVGSCISEISYILEQMANKNFDIEIKNEYMGDFEKIKSSMLFIIRNLSELIEEIISSSK